MPPLQVVGSDPFGVALAGLTTAERDQFDRGDRAFEHAYRASEGLGPVYIRSACGSCHAHDGRGPGTVERWVAVATDGITMAPDQSALPFGIVMRPQFASRATMGITRPARTDGLRQSVRFGPAVVGRGWMEAIADQEIVAQAELQAREGVVSGRVNRLMDGRIGRFGHKARVATLDDFAADAFQGDMGLTSPTRPTEVANPDRLADDDRPGVDLTAETIRDVGFYVRVLSTPERRGLPTNGARLFEATGCARCHTPSMATDPASFRLFAGRRAEVFSDMLLHDMGTWLADGVVESTANEREWRTAPLIGLRFQDTFLHDGRADTVEHAIQGHRGEGSEANFSVDLFDRLSPADRQTLLTYVQGL